MWLYEYLNLSRIKDIKIKVVRELMGWEILFGTYERGIGLVVEFIRIFF